MNGSQTEALAWLASHPKECTVKVEGEAGTGKTYLLRLFAQQNKEENLLFTAPTNKAVQQLQKSVGDKIECKTIYSALSLRLAATEEQELEQGGVPEVFTEATTIVVDECSMITTEVMDCLLSSSSGKKVVFLGDSAQLAPVGEESEGSPVFKQDFPTFTLTGVKRHSGVILEYCQKIRAEQFSLMGHFKLDKRFPVDGEFRSKTVKQREVLTKFISGEAKYLAWKNKTVDSFNKLIRKLYFGDKVAEVREGDQIILTKPLHNWKKAVPNISPEESVEYFTKQNSVPVASTDTLCTVQQVESLILWGVPVWKVALQLENGSNTSTFLVKRAGKGKFKRLLSTLKSRARQGSPQGWVIYYEVEKVFTPLKFAYGLTIHRSQGSTFNTVYADIGDVLSNRDLVSGLKGAYVVMTRAAEELNLVKGGQ